MISPSFSRKPLGANAALLAALCVVGCGTTTPSFHEFYDSEDSATMIEAITEHTQCEVRDAVQFLVLDDRDAAAVKSRLTKKTEQPSLAWLSNWDAQVTLVITVDEKSSLNPSVALTPPLASKTSTFGDGSSTITTQNLSLGIGATGSVDATRKGTISWLIHFKDLLDDTSLAQARVKRDQLYKAALETGAKTIPTTCEHRHGAFIQGDLAFRDWLYTALVPAAIKNGLIGNFAEALSAEAAASKKDVIQDDITFVVLYGGSFNPVFKLLRVAGGQASPPLFGVQRTRTQDLLITLGPEAPDGKLSQAAQNQALASLIGIAVANAIRNNAAP
jgi:hypothetical protein